MRRGWKKVAERGDNPAFAQNEIEAAIVLALKLDCITSFHPTFLNAFSIPLCPAGNFSLPDQF
jgi:hypothetical protein